MVNSRRSLAAAAFFVIISAGMAETSSAAFLSGLKKLKTPGAMLASEGVNVTGELELRSDYVWRGYTLDPDAVLQHGFGLNSKGFTLVYWANWDFIRKGIIDSNELDFSFDYTRNFGGASLSAGTIYYGFYGLERTSRELYAGIELNKLPLTPGIVYYYDYSNGRTKYLSVEASRELVINAKKNLSLWLGGRAGFGENVIEDGKSGEFVLSAELEFPVLKKLSMGLSASRSVPFEESTAGGVLREKTLSAGVSLSTNF